MRLALAGRIGVLPLAGGCFSEAVVKASVFGAALPFCGVAGKSVPFCGMIWMSALGAIVCGVVGSFLGSSAWLPCIGGITGSGVSVGGSGVDTTVLGSPPRLNQPWILFRIGRFGGSVVSLRPNKPVFGASLAGTSTPLLKTKTLGAAGVGVTSGASEV